MFLRKKTQLFHPYYFLTNKIRIESHTRKKTLKIVFSSMFHLKYTCTRTYPMVGAKLHKITFFNLKVKNFRIRKSE